MTVPNPPATGSIVPPRGRARLMPGAGGIPLAPTATQECGARLAVQRGLAEYVEQLRYAALGGAALRLRTVTDEWAEPETNASYPAAVIYAQGPGAYEAASMSPAIDPRCRIPLPDGRYVVRSADYVATVALEIWATNPEERTGLEAMMESALNPNFEKYGFELQLPYYFNQRAAYTLVETSVSDDADQALRRYRLVTFTLKARVPVVQLFSFPDGKPTFVLAELGDSVDLSVVVSTEVT